MRRLAVLLLSAVAFAGLNADADAADKRVVTKAKPASNAPPAGPTSSGLYAGIVGGYDWGRATFSDGFGSTGIRVPSGMAGFTFGYNAQSGSVVYGIETDISGAWLSNTNWNLPPCFACEAKLTYFGTVRGRLGYAVGQFLPYLTAGLAYGGVKAGSIFGPQDTDIKAGWTVGAGVEYAVGGAWSVKSEYLCFELGRMDCDFAACGLPPVAVKFRGNLARVGANYRF